MKTIWKFQIKNINEQIILEMPKGALILTIQYQNGIPCIWAIVDTEKTIETRYFLLKGTGHDLSDVIVENYIATFQIAEHALVFHIFETFYEKL